MIHSAKEPDFESISRRFQEFVGSSAILVDQKYSDHDCEAQKKASQECKNRVRAWAEAARSPSGEFSVYRTSVSHSSGVVVAIGRWGGSGVGVDLERLDRRVSDRAWRRLVRDGECVGGMSRIEVWCIKEACFKASSRSEGTYVSGYWIEGERSESGCGWVSSAQGTRIRYCLLRDQNWCLAFALEESIG